MPIAQAFNRKTKAWVKYKFAKGIGFKALDVKQRNPLTPFKNTPIRGKRR